MITMILLILTVSGAAEAADETVFVHEWGVVLIDEVLPVAIGAERGFLEENGMLQPYYSMIVDAPVLWFHGPEFTGTMTVEVQNGYFSLLIPIPSTISTCDETIPVFRDEENYLAVWDDLSFSHSDGMPCDRPVDKEGISTEEGFQWAMPFWREVPALTVSYEPASYVDRFIYYECSAAHLFGEQDPLEDFLRGAIVFHEEDGKLAADLVVAPRNRIRIEIAVLDEGILEVLSGWGGDEFLDEEINALWKTWKPGLLTRCLSYGETVVVFPLTDDQIESISTIDLRIDQGYSVEYSRLFLAMGSI
ncbi:MAG: hypothetical protein K8S15_08130 [Candidatus Aegiribacteria sp.]|nr:hypothetical protein [Candidatus Aegiribacteria sp.]